MASRSSRPGAAYVGISGYNYPSWRGAFYPHTLRLADWLPYASRTFNSIELNGTFYSLKSPDVFRRWYDETPSGFRFAIKGSRFITHNLKLRRAEAALANFFASGILALEEKTGPFLWQLPATYRFDRERIESFMRLAPRDSRQGARIAAGHDERLRRGALVECAHTIPYRHALEVRHPSYFVPELYELLAAHGWSFVIADTADVFPYAEEVTADFVYVRLHGSRQLYASDYTDEELDRWAARLRGWMEGTPPRDVYVYFDNDMHAHAPRDARRLAERLGCAPPLDEAIALAGASRSRSASSSRGSKARTG
jgi:uncharacterized protein YecE (DUF72 family)